MDGSSSAVPEQPAPPQKTSSANRRWSYVAAIMAGVVLALLVSGGGAAALWVKTIGMFSPQKDSRHPARFVDHDLDRQGAQKQAETLLARAVSLDNEATSQIQSRLDGWRGKLKWDPQLSDLTTVALNSTDHNVRASAIEVQLAAYGLPKSESSVDALVRQASSRDHAQKIWALWTLGLLGNRGIETDRVVQVLTAQLKDLGKYSDEDSRRWAVEGLALVGTTSTIAPLLDVMRNDPSPLVRERAACSLAESGMLSHEQRLIAVPQLINYSDDLALDAQTRGWAFQALADITQQRLPNDPAAWRAWYQTSVGSGQ
jgi:HEAT repeat protein